MKNTLKVSALLAVCFVSLFVTCYRLRATILLPMSNVQRLEWMNGYSGLDCTSFLTVAHGGRHVPEFAEWYSAPNPKHFTVVATFASIRDIDESKLRPGDIASIVGTPYVEDLGYETQYVNGKPFRFHKEFVHYGKHVTAFLRPGVWTDSDTRRGGVAQYDLRSKPSTDDWFQGKVRILRWKEGR